MAGGTFVRFGTGHPCRGWRRTGQTGEDPGKGSLQSVENPDLLIVAAGSVASQRAGRRVPPAHDATDHRPARARNVHQHRLARRDVDRLLPAFHVLVIPLAKLRKDKTRHLTGAGISAIEAEVAL